MHYFYKYDAEKWDWTQAAAHKFKNGFKRFDGFADKKEQVFIGVYGPTQVGKTTFILSLLGIEFKQLNTLSDALRGGQEKGKSATVTCTIFQKADEELFEIIWPTGETFTCSALEEVEQVMQALRRKIYREREFSLSPLMIKIPPRFFNQYQVDQRVRDLSIIDLPGDDSKDELEMRHVNRILKEYIPRCKVNIIMEIASQMTGLTKLDQELVTDWTVLPEQFRVLLTRSVTNGSVKKAIEAGEVKTPEEFVALYARELKRVAELDELDTLIYPLEFGDSWVDLKKSDPGLFEKTNPWMEEIFSALVEDLTRIDSPEQEIKKLKSMGRYVKDRKEKELAGLETAEKKLAGEFEELQLLIRNTAKKGMREERGSISKYRMLIKELKAIKSLREPSYSFHSWDQLDLSEKKASFLNRQFLGELDDLEKMLREHADEVNRFIKRLNLLLDRRVALMEFPEGIFPMSLGTGYLFDRYVKPSSYESDVFFAERQLTSVFGGYQDELNSVVERIASAFTNSLKKKRLRIEAREEELYAQFMEYKQIEKGLLAIRGKIRKASKEWEEDVARARQLDSFLMEGFVEQSNHYKAKLLDEQTSIEEKWLVHQYWNVLKQQAERIIDYVD